MSPGRQDVKPGASEQPGVLERVNEAILALDRDLKLTFINRRAAELLGREPEELLGTDAWAEFPESEARQLRQILEQAMAEQRPACAEVFLRSRWFENRVYPSPDGVSVFLYDITGRKQAEEAARESAALLKGQNQVLELIVRGAELREVLDLLARTIEEESPGMLCSILLLDPDGIHVRHGAAPSLPEGYNRAIDGEPIGPRAGSCGTAAFRREPVIVEDIATDPLWEEYRDVALEYGLRACWSTPIFDPRRRVLGTFACYFRAPARPGKKELKLIEIATYTAAIAIFKHREEEALRTSEERLRLAVSCGQVGIWEWDIAAGRVVWSDRLKAIFGWPAGADNPDPRAVLDAIHPEDRPRVEAALEQACAAGADYNVEYRIYWPDGSLHWVASKGRIVSDAGRLVRAVGVALDITERKRAEEELARREAQLSEAQRIAHLGSYEWDVRTGKVYRSEELYRIFGVSPGQLAPTFEAELERVHPEDRSLARETIEHAFRERSSFDFEERIVRPDGEIVVVQSQGNWIFNEAQEPVKLVGTCQDITERKQAEMRLRQSEERFQIAARATNDMIWEWDLATDSVWWNQGATTLFGYPTGEVRSDLAWWAEHIHPEDVERVITRILTAAKRGECFWSDEYRFQRGDGSYADVFDRGYVVAGSDGKPARMIGAMIDITERKRALEVLEERVAARTAELQSEVSHRKRAEEMLRARNEELKGFAYTVSHDLKAPLRGIAGYAQELDRRHRVGLADRALFCVTQIRAAVNTLDRLIDDLLHYARLDTETPAYTQVDLAAMVEDILQHRNPVIAEQGAEVTLDISPASAGAWERGLLQILTNLIDNALKYSRNARPPRIAITARQSPGVLHIVVSDNGIGFDMKYHDRIFGLFNRLVRPEEFEGTGAGLAIVKKLVDKSGGKIRAESEPGSGAAFFVDLPTGQPAGMEEAA
ncbi:MAG: PAS domain-containing protein [Rhodospirillales bacterium]